jgi:hypothetical protein
LLLADLRADRIDAGLRRLARALRTR